MSCRVLILTLLLTLGRAQGLITVDANISGDQSSASTTVATPAFSTSTANQLLLAFIASDYQSGSNTTVRSVTGAGLTWVLVVRTNVQSGTAEIWRAFATAPLSNVAVIATLSQSVASSITVMSFAGVDTSGTNGSGAIGATSGANASSGAPNASLVTTRNNSWVFGVGNDFDRPIARTPGTGQSLVHQYMPPVGDTYWVQMQGSPTAISGTRVIINDTAPTTDRYNLSICEVLPALTSGTQTWSISGTISPVAAGSGATVTLSGTANATTTADASGNFSFSGRANGSYTVTPSKTGYTFTPASRAVTVNGANVSGVPFTGTAVSSSWGISGTISPAAAGSGATVTLSGTASATTTADASGNFSFSGRANGSYTVTPSKTGYTFTPASRAVTVNGINVSGISFTAAATPSTNLTIDGSVVFQTMDGMGTNINSWSWKNGELRPALDLLISANGANIFRVIHDRMDWAAQAQISGLHSLNPATLAAVYETQDMKDLWNTIAYLNSKGIGGKQILLNFMGWTATWMGGSGRFNVVSRINSANNMDIATMLASLVYYGRVVKGLDFRLLSPFNEPDWNGLEGPQVDSTQYGAIAANIISELNTMGQAGINLVGPDTAGTPDAYIDVMQRTSAVYNRLDHYGWHSYSSGGASLTGRSGRTQWLDETSAWCSGCDTDSAVSDEWSFARDQSDYLLADLANGFTSIMTWEGFDTFYYHHNSYSTWGQAACYQGALLCSSNDSAGTRLYTLRKRGYTTAILNRGIRPGMARIGVTKSVSFPIQAYYNSTTGQLSILGHNTGGSAATISGKLNSLPAVSRLLYYQTDSGAKNFAQQPDVIPSAQTFSVSVPADTFFLLLTAP